MRTRYAAPALALAGVLALAACGGSSSEKAAEKIAEQLTDGSVDLNLDQSGDSGSIKVEGQDGEGSFTFGGGEIPEGVPDELVPPFDYEVQSSFTASGQDGGGFTVALAVDADFDEVAAYYDDVLPNADVVESTTGGSKSKIWTAQSGEGASGGILVTVSDDPDVGTVVTISGGE